MRELAQWLFDPEVGIRCHRPLIGWSVAVVLGVALGYHWGGPMVWLALATGFLLVAWVLPRWRQSLMLVLACLTLAAWRAAEVHEQRAAVWTRLEALRAAGETIPVRVVVSNDCRVIARKRGGPYCRFQADDAWLGDGTSLKGANLTFYYYDRAGRFPRVGEVWQLQARIRKNAWRHRMGLSVRGETAQHLVSEDRTHQLRYRFAALRNRLAQQLTRGIPPELALPTQAMTLGAQTRLPRTTLRRYADAGIIHVLSISGLHFGILAGVLVGIFAGLGVTSRWRWLILTPVLLGYLILTGIPPSAARAFLMATIFFFAPSLYRRANGVTALFATAVIVLVIEPQWIDNVGAILSFGVMGGILLWLQPLTYLLNLLFRSRQRRTPRGRPELAPWTFRFRQTLATLLALTLSAWLAALPLSLYFFGRVSVVGLLLNLLIPSLILLMMWSACLSLTVGFIWEAVAIFFNRANAIAFHLIDQVCEAVLQLPGAVLTFENPPGLAATLGLSFAFLLGGVSLRIVEARLRHADPHDPTPRLTLEDA